MSLNHLHQIAIYISSHRGHRHKSDFSSNLLKWKKFTSCELINLESFKSRNQFLCILSSVAGPLNPKSPSDGLCVQIWFLKRLGLWPPETDDKTVQLLYTIWSYFYRWFFLYVYTLTQILYFLTVEDLRVSAMNNRSTSVLFQ
jgi:hypothetical protein